MSALRRDLLRVGLLAAAAALAGPLRAQTAAASAPEIQSQAPQRASHAVGGLAATPQDHPRRRAHPGAVPLGSGVDPRDEGVVACFFSPPAGPPHARRDCVRRNPPTVGFTRLRHRKGKPSKAGSRNAASMNGESRKAPRGLPRSDDPAMNDHALGQALRAHVLQELQNGHLPESSRLQAVLSDLITGEPEPHRPALRSPVPQAPIRMPHRPQPLRALPPPCPPPPACGGVLGEMFLPGGDSRLLVVGDRLWAPARRDRPHVIGDGKHTVHQLVELVNADPRRGSGHATSLTKIRFDDIAKARLVQQDLTPESVPEKGRRVVLRNNANLSTGGSATDVTDDVHPEVAARAVDAARMVGLHVCGVDVVCETVQRPLEDQAGGIVEVNAAPGLRMHLNPSYGKGRDIGNPIVSELYAPGEDGRIPLVAVTGVNGKTTTTRMITHVLAAQGLCVGMTNTDGVYVGTRQTDSGDCSGPKSARNVLSHPHVQAAVLECARGGILREGLGFDRCSVAVVTNVGTGDHLGLNHIHTVEGIARVKKVIVQNVAPSGYAVLNAADPLVAAMGDECPGQVIYFARDSHHPRIASHRGRGRRVVFVEKGELVAMEGKVQHRLPLAAVPITHGGAIGFQVENTLATVAACWGLNMPWDDIVKGVCSFVNDADNAPGRFNMMNYRGATLVADYGHNPDAINALVQAFKALPLAEGGKRTVVISGAGDRRDEDLREQTRILGASFDHVILYEDQCQRGRSDWEVVKIMRQGLERAARTVHVEESRGEFVAIDAALSLLKGGDKCLILVDQVEQAVAYLEEKCRA